MIKKFKTKELTEKKCTEICLRIRKSLPYEYGVEGIGLILSTVLVDFLVFLGKFVTSEDFEKYTKRLLNTMLEEAVIQQKKEGDLMPATMEQPVIASEKEEILRTNKLRFCNLSCHKTIRERIACRWICRKLNSWLNKNVFDSMNFY